MLDLALGHIAALKKLQDSPGLKTYNLGTGNGYSVLEVIRSMEKASGKTILYRPTGQKLLTCGGVESLSLSLI